MQSLLVRFHRQEEVGPLFLELLKNGFWVWSVSRVNPLGRLASIKLAGEWI
jgi:hypothetical protein